MAPVKFPGGFKCRLFGSSRYLLGLGEYSIDHGEGCSTNSTPPETPVDCKNDIVGEPSAMHVTIISNEVALGGAAPGHQRGARGGELQGLFHN